MALLARLRPPPTACPHSTHPSWRYQHIVGESPRSRLSTRFTSSVVVACPILAKVSIQVEHPIGDGFRHPFCEHADLQIRRRQTDRPSHSPRPSRTCAPADGRVAGERGCDVSLGICRALCGAGRRANDALRRALAHACRLNRLTRLREEDAPLSAMASRLDYESEAAFGRAFKRFLGFPPDSIRRAEPDISANSSAHSLSSGRLRRPA